MKRYRPYAFAVCIAAWFWAGPVLWKLYQKSKKPAKAEIAAKLEETPAETVPSEPSSENPMAGMGGTGGGMAGGGMAAGFRMMAMQRIRDRLKCSDEEWATIEKSIDRIRELRTTLRPRRRRRGRRQPQGAASGTPPTASEQPTTPVGEQPRPTASEQPTTPVGEQQRPTASEQPPTAIENLTKILEKDKPEAGEIAATVEAFRKHRENVTDEIQKEQVKLKNHINLQQEVVLVLEGYLE